MSDAFTHRHAADRPESARRPLASWPGGPFLISTLPPSKSQQFLARALGIVLFVTFLVTLGFRHLQLPRYDAFVAVVNTVVGLNDFITAALLFVHFSLTKHRALLVL